MTYNMQHLFIYLFDIYISSLVRCLLRSCLFFNWIVFLLLSFKSSLCNLGNSPLADMSFANILLPFYGLSSYFLEVAFTEQKFLILMKSSLAIISFMIMPLVLYLKRYHNNQSHLSLPLLSSRNFIVLLLYIKILMLGRIGGRRRRRRQRMAGWHHRLDGQEF